MPLAFYDAIEVVDSETRQPTGQTFADRILVYGFLDDDQHDLPVGFGEVPLDFLGGLPALSINCAACHVGQMQFTGSRGTQRLRILGGPNLADVRGFSQDVYVSILSLLRHPMQLLRLLVQMDRLQPETIAALENLPLLEEGRFDYRPGSSQAKEFLAAVAAYVRELDRTQLDPESILSSMPPAHSRLRRAVMVAPNTFPFFEHPDQDDVGFTFAVKKPRARDPLDDIYRNLSLIFAEAKYFIAQGRFPLATREGFGRLDAFGTVRYLLFSEQSTRLPFTAPVSVPHLWGTGKKKWLHWNANTNSTLQRNMVQSLGMGALDATGGVNNVLVPNLYTLETIAEQIPTPVWPEDVFGPLNAELVARGDELYQARCAGCHDAGQVDAATGLIDYPLFSLSETGTDPNHALNFHQPVGRKSFAASLGNEATQLQNWYSYRRDPRNPVPKSTQDQWGGGPGRSPAVWRDPLSGGTNAPVYAGLPLAGVWATAPYLHNNSVPTLRDLLKPTQDRPPVFRVGNRDYDPINVGYAQPADPSGIPALERFDTREAGNSNAGHEGPAFGADGLTAEDIDALLEYLKSL